MAPDGQRILSPKRISVLVVSILVALGSGTNYVYSAYGPQLTRRLHLSHTQSSIVGIAGNIGVFSSAPIGGKAADSLGPQPLLATSFILLLGGYSGIRYLYDAGIPLSTSEYPTPSYALLILFSFMTGVGGTAGMMSGVNATAKSFPDSARATTTGLVLSGFGLSAFLFSTVAALGFPGKTSSLLLVLALGTALPMILGFFFLKPVPPSDSPTAANNVDAEGDPERRPVVVYHHCDESLESDRLLQNDEMIEACRYEGLSSNRALEYPASSPNASAEVQQLVDESTPSPHWIVEPKVNVFGQQLFKNLNFWLTATTFGLLAGTGLMYINNVGSIAHALAAVNNPHYDEKLVAQIQAKQVTIISTMNCLGRIVMGLTSDYAKNTFQAPRSYCLILSSALFLLSQITIATITNLNQLWMGSILLGFAYGSVFALIPSLCIHYFGMPHFSENFGFTTLSPMVSGYIFSVVFGRTLDEHEASVSPSATAHRCLEGRGCYVSALHFTIGACLLALSLSSFMSFRDRREVTSTYEDRQSREVESG